MANIALCLLHQANDLLNRQIKPLGQQFLQHGDLRERMTNARLASRPSLESLHPVRMLFIQQIASSGSYKLPPLQTKKAVPFGTAWGIKLVLLAAADEQRSGTEGAEGDGRRLRGEREALESAGETSHHADRGRRGVAGATENTRGEHSRLAVDQGRAVISASAGVPSADDQLSGATTGNAGDSNGTSGEAAVGSRANRGAQLGAERASGVTGVGKHLDLVISTSEAGHAIGLKDGGDNGSEVVLDQGSALTVGGSKRSQSERCRDDFIHELYVRWLSC